MSNLVLVFNCGSSSVKFSVLSPDDNLTIISGLVECIGTSDARLVYKIDGDKQTLTLGEADYAKALEGIIDLLKEKELVNQICAVGHRVVHGGEYFSSSVKIDQSVIEKIKACNMLAPLHNPANVLGIETAQAAFPHLPHTAVFDTAFHQSMPKHAYLYAVPYEWYEEHHVRRYGFHGTSHQYVAMQAAHTLNQPLEELALITAHLGNGCSVTAVSGGKSIDTSMGLTPLEGLMMGTRSGDLDPGLHVYLSNVLGISIDEVTNQLNKKSGLLGVSGQSMDMRVLEDLVAAGDTKATLALEMFVYRLSQYIARFMVSLSRLDALVFTGGIGENSTFIREKVIKQLAVFGFKLDDARNNANGKGFNQKITTDDSSIALVIPTNEELMIAREALKADLV